MSRDKRYLSDIYQCILLIEEYTTDGQETFMNTRLIQDGVIRNFEVIGEATKRLSEELRSNYPSVPWKQMAGFRDVLIHDYLRVDSNEVWDVVANNVPDLKANIEQILQNL
jgi:uncharacterized protein with HEPN domain